MKKIHNMFPVMAKTDATGESAQPVSTPWSLTGSQSRTATRASRARLPPMPRPRPASRAFPWQSGRSPDAARDDGRPFEPLAARRARRAQRAVRHEGRQAQALPVGRRARGKGREGRFGRLRATSMPSPGRRRNSGRSGCPSPPGTCRNMRAGSWSSCFRPLEGDDELSNVPDRRLQGARPT